MKKIILVGLALLVATGVFAQAVPQPAFRLLDGYLEKRAYEAEYGAKVGPWVLMGTGAALGVGAATVWFAGDAIADGAGHGRMDPQVKFGTAVGLAVGSVVLTGIGYALHKFPPVNDERAQYSAIYQEKDPTLQESLAAARLKSNAENGKDTRVVSGWVNLALAGASFAFAVAENRDKGRSWSYGLLKNWGWQTGSLIGGATSLLVRSEEEALYDEYLFVVARTRG